MGRGGWTASLPCLSPVALSPRWSRSALDRSAKGGAGEIQLLFPDGFSPSQNTLPFLLG